MLSPVLVKQERWQSIGAWNEDRYNRRRQWKDIATSRPNRPVSRVRFCPR